MKIVYFSWVREKIGKAEEYCDLPEDVITVRDLIVYLQKQGDAYADALSEPDIIRVAVDHEHADYDHPVSGATEIALFPPMTGG